MLSCFSIFNDPKSCKITELFCLWWSWMRMFTINSFHRSFFAMDICITSISADNDTDLYDQYFFQPIFQRCPRPEKEYQSFSLIYSDRSLDLVQVFYILSFWPLAFFVPISLIWAGSGYFACTSLIIVYYDSFLLDLQRQRWSWGLV